MVELIAQSVSARTSGQLFPVNVGQLSFQIIDLESKVVGLVNLKNQVVIQQLLRSSSKTTSIRRNGDYRLFDDFNRITVGHDFTEIVVVSNTFNNRNVLKELQNFTTEDCCQPVTSVSGFKVGSTDAIK